MMVEGLAADTPKLTYYSIGSPQHASPFFRAPHRITTISSNHMMVEGLAADPPRTAMWVRFPRMRRYKQRMAAVWRGTDGEVLSVRFFKGTEAREELPLSEVSHVLTPDGSGAGGARGATRWVGGGSCFRIRRGPFWVPETGQYSLNQVVRVAHEVDDATASHGGPREGVFHVGGLLYKGPHYVR